MAERIRLLNKFQFYKYTDEFKEYLVIGHKYHMKTYELFESLQKKYPDIILNQSISLLNKKEAEKIINQNVPWARADEMIKEVNLFQKRNKNYLIIREI